MELRLSDPESSPTLTLPIGEFLHRFTPPGDISWDELCIEFEQDPFDRENIEILREALKRDGSFEEPVVVSTENNEVVSGQHRIVAIKLEEHPIVTYSEKHPSVEAYPDYEICALLTDTAPFCEDVPLFDSAFRTFHVAGSVWCECTVGTSNGTPVLSTSCPDELLPSLLELIRSRFERIGFDVAQLHVSRIG